MLIQKEPPETATRFRKARLTIVIGEAVAPAKRKMPARAKSKPFNYLLPPVNQFNTGYLKEKKNDPL